MEPDPAFLNPVMWRGGRVFISPAVGCPGRCRFCYLAGEEQTQSVDVEATWARVSSDPRFRSGSTGSVVSIGCLGDPLAPLAFAATIAFLAHAGESGNRVQIATRWTVAGNRLSQLIDALRHSNAVVYHSMTSISRTRVAEPRTPAIARRLDFIRRITEAFIPSVLYIKPVLAGLTDRDANRLAALASGMEMSSAVVGGLWASPGITASLAMIDVDSGASPKLSAHPLSSESRDLPYAGSATLRLIDAFERRGVPVCRHSLEALEVARRDHHLVHT